VNEEEARAALQEARERKLRECEQELMEILKRYNCRLVAMPQFTPDGRIMATVSLSVEEAR